MKKTVKVGYIGVGRRGYNMLKCALLKMKDVEIVAVCDLNQERLDASKEAFIEAGRKLPVFTTDYRELLRNEEIEGIFLFTNWNGRVKLAIESMKCGKYTAMEVGAANTLEECFELVKTYEETKVPVMMLENICYGKFELTALNMVKKGLFGEIVHCAGGYCHYLNEVELFKEMTKLEPKSDKVTHYRLKHYIDNNCENYPTHELGPISKILGINRGNRMLTLSSFASKARGLKTYAKKTFGEDSEYAKIDYKQGDIVNTVITCAGGETILLTLDTTLPRPFYSRQFTVRGTEGMCYEDGKVFFLDTMEEKIRDNFDEMFKEHAHPLSREVDTLQNENTNLQDTFGLHGNGVDWMIFRAFIESIKNKTNTPIDAYDTAAWLAIGPLSKKSIENGGAPVDVPDFTDGKWQNREPVVRSKYCLDEIVEDDSIGIYDSIH